MAQLAANFSDDLSRYEQVIFQRGKVVIDGELNEIGRLQRVVTKRLRLADRLQSLSTAPAMHDVPVITPGFRIVTAEEDGLLGPLTLELRGVADGAVHRATLFECRGYVFEFTETESFVLPAYGGGDSDGIERFQVVAVISELERTSGDDPDIKVDKLSETAVRTKINVQFILGASNDDTVSDLNSAAEAWQGSDTAVLIATVVRDASSPASLSRGNIQYHFRSPQELRELNMRFFHQGSVMLRAAMGTEVAASAEIRKSSGDPDRLIIHDLSLVIGGQSWNNDRDIITVDLGSIEIEMDDFPTGSALVAYLPNNPAGHPVQTLGSGGLAQYNGVFREPGVGEVKLAIEPAYNWGDAYDSDDNDKQDFSNRVIICAHTMFPPLNVTANTYEYDVVFADGQRLGFTRDLDVVSSSTPGGEREISWHHCPALATPRAPHPQTDYAPSYASFDENPYKVGLSTPKTAGTAFKNMFSHPVEAISGEEVNMDFHVAREMPANFPGFIGSQGLAHDGFVLSHNAHWDASGAEWNRYVNSRNSVKFVFSNPITDVSDMEDVRGPFFGMALHGASRSNSWAEDEWEGAGGTPPANLTMMLTWDGSLFGDFSQDPHIEGHKLLNLNGNGDHTPGGAGNEARTNTLYARNVPKAFARVAVAAGGAPTIDTFQAYNIDTAQIIDPGGTGRAYLNLSFKTNLTSAACAVASVNDHIDDGNNTVGPEDEFVIHRVLCTPTAVRIYAYRGASGEIDKWLGAWDGPLDICVHVMGRQI